MTGKEFSRPAAEQARVSPATARLLAAAEELAALAPAEAAGPAAEVRITDFTRLYRKWILQEREMAYATGRCMCNGLLRHPFSVEHVTLMVRHVYGERVTFYSGDGEVAPGVTVHRVGGHSDGLQVVRVDTARGPVVLASDASHFFANLHRRSPFPIVYNIGDMAVGWETVERLAGHPDRFIPGHDPIVAEIYPRASDKVDAFALHLDPSRSFAK